MSESNEDDSTGLNPKKSPLTTAEKSIILALIRDKKAIVESKKTDFGTTGKKQEAWDDIASKFNSQPNCSRRTTKQIRIWWDNAKKRNKKVVTKHKREIRRTGGGRKPPDLPPEAEEVMAIVPSQMESLENEFDCDGETDGSFYENSSIPEPGGHTPETNGHSMENVDDPVLIDLANVEKTVKPNVRDPRSSLVDFEFEEHQWRLKILQIEYSTAVMKRSLVQKQLDHFASESKLKLAILKSQLTGDSEIVTENREQSAAPTVNTTNASQN